MIETESNMNSTGLPAGVVTNTPQGQAALQRIANMNLSPGESADAIQGQLGEPYTNDKEAGFREDYRVPSQDANDTTKQEAYVKDNKDLLKKHKWMPNIKSLLEGEVKAVSKDLSVLKDGIKLEHDMRCAELDKVRADAKSKMLKKKAGISGRDYNRMAQEAIPDINKAAENFDARFGALVDRATNFTKNVIGRHHEQYDLNREIGHYGANVANNAEGSLAHTTNTEMLNKKKQELSDLRSRVRMDRTHAAVSALGATGIGMTINDEIQRRKQYKYASIQPGTEDTHTTLQLSTERGTMAGDALHALETIKTEPTYAKKKLLAATAVAAVSAAVGMYGMGRLVTDPTYKSMIVHADKSKVELGKLVAEVLPYVTATGGAYYAYQNKDNNAKRNLGIGLVGASALGRFAASRAIPQAPAGVKLMGREQAMFAGGAYTMAGAMGYAAHKAQEIANHEAVHNAMHSDLPIEDVTKIVNTVRGKNSLFTRYPVTRYIKMPAPVYRLLNSKMGVPAGAMNNDDRAYYHEAQVTAEFDKLKRRYEANLGRLNQAGTTDLKQMAIDNVNGRGM